MAELHQLVERAMIWTMLVRVSPIEGQAPKMSALAFAKQAPVPFDLDALGGLKRAFEASNERRMLGERVDDAVPIARLVADRWLDLDARK